MRGPVYHSRDRKRISNGSRGICRRKGVCGRFLSRERNGNARMSYTVLRLPSRMQRTYLNRYNCGNPRWARGLPPPSLLAPVLESRQSTRAHGGFWKKSLLAPVLESRQSRRRCYGYLCFSLLAPVLESRQTTRAHGGFWKKSLLAPVLESRQSRRRCYGYLCFSLLAPVLESRQSTNSQIGRA